MKIRPTLGGLLLLAAIVSVAAMAAPSLAQSSSAPAASSSSESSQTRKDEKNAPAGQAAGGHQETSEEEEENANLKYSTMVEKFGRLFGLNVHQAYLVAKITNFLLIGFLIYWFARKSVPAMMRSRTAAIQQALVEARRASQEANQRLAEIEARLGKLGEEIKVMQAAAEQEGEAEDARIKAAAEEEIRKVAASAEQEIAAAAKQARRELTAHTADLAISLARKQIHLDTAADQSLVRAFATKLSPDGGKDRN